MKKKLKNQLNKLKMNKLKKLSLTKLKEKLPVKKLVNFLSSKPVRSLKTGVTIGIVLAIALYPRSVYANEEAENGTDIIKTVATLKTTCYDPQMTPFIVLLGCILAGIGALMGFAAWEKKKEKVAQIDGLVNLVSILPKNSTKVFLERIRSMCMK